MYHAEENTFNLRIVKMAVISSVDPHGSTLFSFTSNSIFYTNRNYTTYNKNLQTQVFNYVGIRSMYIHIGCPVVILDQPISEKMALVGHNRRRTAVKGAHG